MLVGREEAGSPNISLGVLSFNFVLAARCHSHLVSSLTSKSEEIDQRSELPTFGRKDTQTLHSSVFLDVMIHESSLFHERAREMGIYLETVSYTHLTLPTN